MKRNSTNIKSTGNLSLVSCMNTWLILFLFVLPFNLVANNTNTEYASVKNNITSDVDYGEYLWNAIGIKNYKAVVVGGDFSLDFVASAPLTYNHQTGGGFYDDRTIGRDKDVVESLEGGDFQCGDRVTYLTAITVKSTASGTQTIELDYSFLAASTGQRGVALGEILLVQVNAGDPGMIDTGESATATLNGGYPGTITGVKFVKPTTLTGTVTVTGLNPGDKIIVRMDVLIECEIPSSPTGNLQGTITAGRVVIPPILSKKDATISVGKQTVPFKNVNLIGQGGCTLNDFTDVCEGEIQDYTASSTASTTATYTWALTGNAVFVDGLGATISNPGNSVTARVKATAPSGTTGCYKVTVTVSADQHSSVVCCDLVTVNAIPPAPTVSLTEPTVSICGTSTLGTVTVNCPLNPASSPAIYQYSNDGGTTWQTSPIFGSIAASAGFSVTVRRIGTTCVSAATNCTNYASRTCSTPSITSCSLDPCPINGTASIQSQSSSLLKGVEPTKIDESVSAYPVPFRGKTTVEFKLAKSERYEVNLYDMRGNLIKQLKSGKAKAGELQQIEVDGQGLPEGMYLVRMVNGKGSQTVKLLKKD
jgi:hypothetical protein